MTFYNIANLLECMAMSFFIKELKQNLIPAEVTQAQASIIYANEAYVLNVAMFCVTAKHVECLMSFCLRYRAPEIKKLCPRCNVFCIFGIY